MEKCNLPNPLQGLEGAGEMAGLDTENMQGPENKDQPFVCFAAEGLPFHTTQESGQTNNVGNL